MLGTGLHPQNLTFTMAQFSEVTSKVFSERRDADLRVRLTYPALRPSSLLAA